MNIFYESHLAENMSVLGKNESHHCIKVLRMKEGEHMFITNGKGLLSEAVLVKADPGGCMVDIIDVKYDYGKRPFKLHMAVAPTKSIDRYEWFLEKAVECGVDFITPLICEYSERKVIKPDRLEKILVSAMKQSGRAYLPVLNPLINFSEFINSNKSADCFIAHCAEGEKQPITSVVRAGKDVTVMIGPEGDFSEKEISDAISKGFMAISMGGHRLRTETAAMAACVQINSINGML